MALLLDLEMIYLQAKRYTDKKVGRPEIQAFTGALDMHRAKKGEEGHHHQ